jgi:hypothetical protein
MRAATARIMSCVVVALATPCAADMTLISRPIAGIVIEEGTGKPIPGAILSAVWEGAWSGTATSGTRCAKGMAVESDAAGRFRFPEWSASHTDLLGLGVEVTPYKAGYLDTRPGRAGAAPRKVLGIFESHQIEIPPSELRIQMKPFTGSDAERSDYLRRFLNSTECRETGDMIGMNPLYRAIRDEVQRLPASIRDQKTNAGQWSLLEIVEKNYLSRTEGPRAGESSSQIDYPK